MSGGGEIDHCLGVEVSGQLAHFRQVGGNSTRQTYRIIPRTTAAGLLAAIVGFNRDSYYDVFGPEASAMAIVPTSPLTTVSIPKSELDTKSKNMGDVGEPVDRELGMETVKREAMDKRQRNPYQMLRDVSYRLYVNVSDEMAYDSLRNYLSEGRSHYTPSLGLSECLAEVEYLGECDVSGASTDQIDSALPGHQRAVVPTEGVEYGRERSPGFMEATSDGGRRTTEFLDITYRSDGGAIRLAGDVPVRRVTGPETEDRVVFS